MNPPSCQIAFVDSLIEKICCGTNQSDSIATDSPVFPPIVMYDANDAGGPSTRVAPLLP
jgi:hypothetical protein